MRVARGRRCLGVPEESADDRQAEAGAGADRGKAVAQIMQSNIIEACVVPHPPPRLFDIDEMPARPFARQHMRIAGDPRQFGKELQGRRRQVDDLLAGLGVGQP